MLREIRWCKHLKLVLSYISRQFSGYANAKAMSEKMPQLDGQLAHEMKRLDDMFWIGRQKLKQIVKGFVEELDEGLQDDEGNIVGSPIRGSFVERSD